MCSGVRRGGEANNAIRGLASVSQTHTHTQTHTAVFVFIYHSSSHIDDNKGRKAVSRIERVRNRKGKRRKERKVAEKKRETELKGCLERWTRENKITAKKHSEGECKE